MLADKSLGDFLPPVFHATLSEWLDLNAKHEKEKHDWLLLLVAIVKHYGDIEVSKEELASLSPAEIVYTTTPLTIKIQLGSNENT